MTVSGWSYRWKTIWQVCKLELSVVCKNAKSVQFFRLGNTLVTAFYMPVQPVEKSMRRWHSSSIDYVFCSLHITCITCSTVSSASAAFQLYRHYLQITLWLCDPCSYSNPQTQWLCINLKWGHMTTTIMMQSIMALTFWVDYDTSRAAR